MPSLKLTLKEGHFFPERHFLLLVTGELEEIELPFRPKPNLMLEITKKKSVWNLKFILLLLIIYFQYRDALDVERSKNKMTENFIKDRRQKKYAIDFPSNPSPE